MGFVEAVRDLAQQAGLAVPEEPSQPGEREEAARQKQKQLTLNDVLARAAEGYRRQLKASDRAIAYLKGRGLSGEIAARFGIGYATRGWRGLASVFPSYDDPLLEKAAWSSPTPTRRGRRRRRGAEHGKRYDRFRDRIMFPIRSVQGAVIGFGGRVLDRGEPKYLNSPETPVFGKGRELYGLFEARTAIRERGMRSSSRATWTWSRWRSPASSNAVATLGTACTAEHVQKLVRFTESVVFSFDGDAAGRRAAARALEASLPHAVDTRTFRFLFLPAEHDPDSFVRERGAAAFEQASRGGAAVAPDRRARRRRRRPGTAEGRARFLANARPLWSALARRHAEAPAAGRIRVARRACRSTSSPRPGARRRPAAPPPSDRAPGGPPRRAPRPPMRQPATRRLDPAPRKPLVGNA